MSGALVYLLTELILSKFPFLLKLLGVKQLTHQEIQRVKEQAYPESYSKFYFLLSLVEYLLGISILVLAWLSGSFFYSIQKNIFGANAIYFSSDGNNWIFILINVFGLFFIIGSTFYVLLYNFASKHFRDYLTLRMIENKWVFNPRALIQLSLTIGIIYYLILSPLLFLLLKDFNAVYPNRVIANKLFSLNNSIYQFEDIEKVVVTSSIWQELIDKNTNITTSLFFYFRDGRKVSFLQGPIIKEEIGRLYSELRNRQVNVIIEQPSQEVLNVVAQRCTSYQSNFNALFELNLPIVNSSDC